MTSHHYKGSWMLTYVTDASLWWDADSTLPRCAKQLVLHSSSTPQSTWVISLHLPLPAQLPQSTAAQLRELEQHRNRHREGTLQQQEPCYHPANSSAGTALVQDTTLAQATREGPALQSQQQMKRFHPASSTPAAVSVYSGWMLFEGIHFIVSCLSAVPPEPLTGC